MSKCIRQRIILREGHLIYVQLVLQADLLKTKLDLKNKWITTYIVEIIVSKYKFILYHICIYCSTNVKRIKFSNDINVYLQLKPFLSLHRFIVLNLSFYRCKLPNQSFFLLSFYRFIVVSFYRFFGKQQSLFYRYIVLSLIRKHRVFL